MRAELLMPSTSRGKAAGFDPTKPVVLITGKDPLNCGGLHSYVRAHALAAAAAGFSPQVFCLAPRASTIRTDFGTLHRVATPLRPIMGSMAIAHRPFLVRAVSKCLADVNSAGPYVVHSFGAWALVGAEVCRSLAAKGVAAVPVASAYTTTKHENRAMLDGLRFHHGPVNAIRFYTRYLWTHAVGNLFEGRGYKASRLILVNYASVEAILHQSFGSSLHIRRMPYASDAAFRFAEPEATSAIPQPIRRLRPAEAPLLVAISRHDPHKGLDVLLRALAGLAEAGVTFRACLVGPGRLLAAHKRLATRLGLDEHVAIPGYVDDVFAYLHHADLFVLPSLEEGGGSLSVLEALQSGTAVVASNCDGLPEDLTDGDDSLLVPPGDERALQVALERLLVDASLRENLAARARDVYKEKFSAAALVDALRRAYAEAGALP